MATVNYFLGNPKAKKSTAVYMIILSKDYGRIKINTGKSTLASGWDSRKGKFKSQSANAALNNILLNDQKDNAERYLIDCEDGKIEFNLEELKSITLNKDNKKPNSNGQNFWEIYDHYVSSTKHKKKASTNTVYNTTKSHLKDFEKWKKQPLRFSIIDEDFYNQFSQFLTEEKELSNNTQGKYIKTLKVILNYAASKGLINQFQFKKFKVLNERAELFALEEDELEKIKSLDLTDNITLDNARDWFLLSCYTGLRYSDYTKITRKNIKGNFINWREAKSKNREIRTIPLTFRSKAIIQKIINGELKSINNPDLNVYLKDLGKMAEINGPFSVSKFIGSKEVEKTGPKYEFISTHTGRRTFITLSLIKGMRPEIVKRISGHKKWEDFDRYIQLSDERVFENYCEIWK